MKKQKIHPDLNIIMLSIYRYRADTVRNGSFENPSVLNLIFSQPQIFSTVSNVHTASQLSSELSSYLWSTNTADLPCDIMLVIVWEQMRNKT